MSQNLCVCCEENKHAGYPDADLGGYVCGECSKHIQIAVRELARAKIFKCTGPINSDPDI